MKNIVVIVLMVLISCGHATHGWASSRTSDEGEGLEKEKRTGWRKIVVVGGAVSVVIVSVIGVRAILKLRRARKAELEEENAKLIRKREEYRREEAEKARKREKNLNKQKNEEEFKQKAKLWENDTWELSPDSWGNLRRKKFYTEFWPHEAIGTVEVREFLQELSNQGYPLSASDVAVIDMGFPYDASGTKLSQAAESFLNLKEGYQLKKGRAANRDDAKIGRHGMQVASIIAGKSPVGTSINARISYLEDSIYDLEEINIPSSGVVNFSWSRPPTSEFDRKLSNALRLDLIPDSLDIPEAELDRLLGGDAIIVQAAGNEFPDSDAYWKVKAGIEVINNSDLVDFGSRVIKVGSVAPDGFVSSFSKTGKDVVVLAPSDNSIISYDGKKQLNFGGTSGAAPLVTAALADVLSILPELKRSEARELLQRTAIKTSINEVSDMNGAGVLNHYKLVRVAKRLADLGYPKNRAALFNDALYDFSAEARELHASATDSDDLNTYLKKLRTAFLLDADNADIRTELSDTYRKAGLKKQAEFFDVPAESLQKYSYAHHALQERVRWGTRSDMLFFNMVETINDWLYINGKVVKSGVKKINLSELGDAPVLKVDRDNLQQALRLAEDIELRETTVLRHLIKYAQEEGKDDILHTLKVYAQHHYPSLNL